jgi:phytoene synthase
MEALYSFMRHTDDLADGEATGDDARRALAAWREALDAALAGCLAPDSGENYHTILPALADTVDKFQIPPEYLRETIAGVEMDLSNRRYETFDELAEYCYRVASVIGLACLRIWGYRGDDPAESAHACGQAFQLTNILRDLREDCGRCRVYLPQEDLRRFGYPEEDLAAGVGDERFRALMRFQLERVEQFYQDATPLARQLETEGRRIFVMMIRVYYRLLQAIQADPTRVLSQRVCLGRWRPLGIMARTFLRPSTKAVLP